MVPTGTILPLTVLHGGQGLSSLHISLTASTAALTALFIADAKALFSSVPGMKTGGSGIGTGPGIGTACNPIGSVSEIGFPATYA